MKYISTLLFICLCILNNIFAQQTYKAVRFKNYGITSQEKLMVLTLAGIVNRESPRLFLENVFETWSYRETDEKWGEIYQNRGNVEFEDITSISTLLDKFSDDIEGCITYNGKAVYGNFSGQAFLYQGEFAAMLGGLTNRLPIADSDLDKYPLLQSDDVTVTDCFDGDADKVVTAHLELPGHAWNDDAKTTEEKYLTLLDYGIDNLLPLCNPEKFFIREITDFAVQQRMFQLDIAGTSSLDFYSMSTPKADILEHLLLYFKGKNPTNIFHVYGWISPEPMCQWISAHGASFHESMQANLSWHHVFPCEPQTYEPPSKQAASLPNLDAKHYITFVGSEGDASNWVIGFQAGAWLSESRGEVPVNWGWNLHFFDMFPFVAKYYYETATELDGFVSVTTPLGYTYPDLWQNDVWLEAIDSTRRLMDDFGVDIVYGYKHYAPSGELTFRGTTISNSFDFERYGDFQDAIGCPLTMLYDPKLPLQKPVVRNNALMFNHCEDGSFYGVSNSVINMASRIATSIKLQKRPSFTIGGYQRLRQDNFGNRTAPTDHDMSVGMLRQVMDKLKADENVGPHVEVVTAARFARLMQEQMDNPVGINQAENVSVQFSNYPNPIDNQTTIEFDLPFATALTIDVTDVSGRVVKIIDNGFYQKGRHKLTYNATYLHSGIYFCRLKSDNFSKSIKLLKK